MAEVLSNLSELRILGGEWARFTFELFDSELLRVAVNQAKPSTSIICAMNELARLIHDVS